MSREEEIRASLFDDTLNGRAPEVKGATTEGLALGMDPMDILFKALIPSLEEVGRRFEKGDFFVPEMLMAARAMQGALTILRPLIAETGAQPVGRYVIGTVKGDIHDIGKNLVVIMLEGAGFEVFDLGVNTPPEKFVEAVIAHEPDVLGFSAFLTTTMPMFKVNIDALTKAGLRDKVHIAVGGAPVTEEYAKHVGADSYAPDASMATRLAKQLVGARNEASQGAQALEQAVKLIDETLKKG
jgi:5-methyltetrahydrofolate--homocysteine methyltransferase